MKVRWRRIILKLVLAFPVIWFIYIISVTFTDDSVNDDGYLSKFSFKKWESEATIKKKTGHFFLSKLHEQSQVHRDHVTTNDVINNNPLVVNSRRPIEAIQNVFNKSSGLEESRKNILNFEKKDQLRDRKDKNDTSTREGNKKSGKEERKEAVKEKVEFPKFVAESEPDGPGEGGTAFYMNLDEMTPAEKSEYKEGKKRNSFNQFASDRISVRRRLDDVRHQDCKTKKFHPNLQQASIIVCFHNEAWSTLLRTVHSIIDRSPLELLKEIILVDDQSTMEHLKRPLDVYMTSLPKVRIIRAHKRQGLIRARLLGYQAATAPILVFLDAHIECTPGWLEPLLDRIVENPKSVPFPLIDTISSSSFSVTIVSRDPNWAHVGIFRWQDLTFQWASMSDETRRNRSSRIDPIPSPTMPGGLFAIRKDWFTTLGTYDPGLDYWGGENLELSFKVWMCNGSVEVAPCSHVAHVFRHINPIKWITGGEVIRRNSIRVAEVWLDDYKNLYHESFNYKTGAYGDVLDRKKLRESLHCHDFHWYRKHVYPHMPIPEAVFAGEIRSEVFPNCIDSMEKNENPRLYPCHGQGRRQFWRMKKDGTIVQDGNQLCFQNNTIVFRHVCKYKARNWKYIDAGHLYHPLHNKCLQSDSQGVNLLLEPCSNGSRLQKWIFPKRRWNPPPI